MIETSTNKSKELLNSMAHDHVSDITQANKDLVESIKAKLEEISSLKSIFRVPEKLQEANPKVYIPGQVSIGPLHHGKETLKNMEEHKWHYLYTLLSRKPNLEASLHRCVKALRELEKAARKFYAEELSLESDDRFIEIMLLDGCFIIELLLKYAIKRVRRRADPIFATPGMLYNVMCDLILLENQIPLRILQRLFDIVPIPIQCNHSLPELAFHFFKKMLPGDEKVLSEKFSQEGNHLLDLIRQCYLPTYARVQSKNPVPLNELECASATELRKYGIKFMRFTAKSLLDIRFANGIIEVDPLTIHPFTEILFSNLIALELHQSHVQHFTSYALLMRAFICNENDAKLFRHLRIVVNDEGTEKDICDLFMRLCRGVESVKGNFCFAGLLEQITEHKTSQRSWWKTVTRSCLKTRTST